jgi:hypothetical protein
MKKLVFTTAVALALATTAYAADHHGGGGPGPSMGGGGGNPGLSAHGPSSGPSSGPSNFSAPRGPSGPNSMSGLNNRAPTNMNSYKQGGQNFDKGRFSDKGFSDKDRDRRLYNRADRDHDFDRERHSQGNSDLRHHGVVRGDFFEHGRHFHFRRFFHGEWVFLTGWDDCTAWAWVHVAPGVWAWRPVDICVG